MIRVVSWNIGGAKYLELPPGKRDAFANNLNEKLCELTQKQDPPPDFIVLQEIVKCGDRQSPSDPLVPPPGYCYDASIAIDTVNQSHPTKWQKYFDRGKWDPATYLAQGYGILWRKEIEYSSIWDFEPKRHEDRKAIEKEVIRLDTGLFTGTRDTEPRLAVVTHFVLTNYPKPVDIFIVNLHLTTLQGEREGSPKIDGAASRIRLGQLDVVLNGVVSRYNEWINVRRKDASTKKEKKTLDRAPAIWILAGDYNCMPESNEIKRLKEMNFIDLNPHKGAGTKGSGVPIKKGTITLDYIFAGPAYYALDPFLVGKGIDGNPTPLDNIQVSDHFPIRADIPIIISTK